MTRADFDHNLRAHAQHWLGTPFRWHGQTRYGADCLGLVLGVLRAAGVPVPTGDGSPYETHWFLHDRDQNRYLTALLEYGREVETPEPGDLVAFWNRNKTAKVVHSGLYIGGRQFLHTRLNLKAAIDSLDDRGYKSKPITIVRLRAVEGLLQ